MKSMYSLLLVFATAHLVLGECQPEEHAPHPYSCEGFLKCSNGVFVEMFCPPGLLFNSELGVCDWPENVDCTPSYQTPPSWNSSTQSNSTTPSTNATTPSGSTTTSNVTASVPVPPSGSTTSSPSKITCSSDSQPATLPHPNCEYFYMCSNGEAFEIKCQDGLVWNQIEEYCDYPENANCLNDVAPPQ